MAIIIVADQADNTDIQPAIQTAVNSATDGDTISLPTGIFTFGSTIITSKKISIVGQGKTNTILYRSESMNDNAMTDLAIFNFNTDSSTSSGTIVSDIGFRSKLPSITDGDGFSRAEDIGISFYKNVGFIVRNCKFEYFGNGAVSVTHDDSLANGLIYNNEFVHNCKGYDALGLGYGVVVYGTNYSWVTNPKFGSSNFIFVEDNTFDYHRHSIAAGGAALYVFRHNQVNNNIAGDTAHAIDAHDGRGGSLGTQNYFSTRAIEVYNNTVINTKFRDGSGTALEGQDIIAGQSIGWLTEACIRPRGGEAIIYNNYIQGYRFGVGLYANGNPPYPALTQEGYLSGLNYGARHTGSDAQRGDGDVFIWNNTFDYYDITNSGNVPFYNYTTGYIVLERDYHLFKKPGYLPYKYPHPSR